MSLKNSKKDEIMKRRTFITSSSAIASVILTQNLFGKGIKSMKKIDNIAWYTDKTAPARKEPGLQHSYYSSLATIIKYKYGKVDPVWLMGTSGMAFRIWVNKGLCPSAMSIFDWSQILPQAPAQYGMDYKYISRLWHENDVKDKRQIEAIKAIKEAINNNTPAIVWDIELPEWGLITGYDDEKSEFITLSCLQNRGTMKYELLGERAVKVLSVMIIGNKKHTIAEKEVIDSSLKTAVAHWSKREWMERPEYEDAAEAYDYWADAIVTGTKEKTNYDFAKYYADCYCSSKCYARDYLKRIAKGNKLLEKSSDHFAEAAEQLKRVSLAFVDKQIPDKQVLKDVQKKILLAKDAENKAQELLKKHVEMH